MGTIKKCGIVSHGGRDRFVCDDELESDNRSPVVSSAKLRKRVFRRLHPQVTIEIRNINVRSLFDQVCAENFL